MPQEKAGLWAALSADERHGPLPGLLLMMTLATGAVDAVSILSLGRVFVANMTGNVVFIGFALVGARGFSLAASLFALGGFLLGAFGAGVALARYEVSRVVLLRAVLVVEVVLLGVALVLALASGSPIGAKTADVIAGLMAVALGAQNTMARRLAVPDLTTTVLTMTLTGIAADVRAGNRTVVARRVLAVLAMLAGAVAGALLDIHVAPAAAILLPLLVLGAVLGALILARRRPGSWQA